MIFTKFTMYGERCSGTNFIRKLIFDNFFLDYVYLPNTVYGWKHWFGNEKNKEAIRTSSECIIFSIVRNPVDYLVSFFNNPHNQSKERTKNFVNFLSSEFYSVSEDHENEELDLDHNIENLKNRYKDIFEMRNIKNKFLYLIIPTLTSNSHFLRYEDLKNNTVYKLAEIELKFGLKRRSKDFIVEKRRILPESGLGWNKFELSDVPLRENYLLEDTKIKEIIKTRLDFDIEMLVGYNKDSIMKQLM